MIQHLRGLNFVDSYATFHDDQGGTWSNKYTSKRLDQIWLSPESHLELLYCDTNSTIIYQTDYRVLATYFLTDNLFHRPQPAQSRRHNNMRWVFKYKKATADNGGNSQKLLPNSVQTIILTSSL